MPKVDLHRASRMGLERELAGGIAAGADVNGRDQLGATPLQWAIAKRHERIADLLLRLGADVTNRDAEGYTALHYAIEYDFRRLAEQIVLSNPAVCAISDNWGNQPLWTATFNVRGDYGVVAFLVQHGADPTHRNDAGMSAVYLAMTRGEESLAAILGAK